MTNLTRTSLTIAIAGATALGGVLPALAATTTPAGQGQGQGTQRGRGQARGQILDNLSERLTHLDFAGAGVAQPSFWGDFTTWAGSNDAKKVAQWLLTNRPAQGERPALTWQGPLAILQRIDFTAAGVTKPAFWDQLLTWLQGDDAEKLFEHQQSFRGGERFERLSTELGAVDFSKVGIAKPAFWGDLLSWLKSGDATKLGVYLFQQHAPARGANAPANQ